MADKFSKAWPNKQYNGDEKHYEEYESDKGAWIVDNKYETLGTIDPSKR
jgi:hypothetical protein